MLTGHPRGLYRLFFIEMWERLAFYTMVGILLLYTVDTERGGLGLPQAVGAEIYGLYLAFVYFTPYLGGMVADRFLGYRRSVLLGGIFFAVGFFLMGIYGEFTFVTGIVCLCIGNGLFKPNISAMVGNLYQAGDPKRDAGFNIFYMGINVGAFVANFLAAVMKNEAGWLWIFRAAGIGMCLSIVILLASWKVLERADRKPGLRPGDTPFSEVLLKILGPALVAGVVGYLLAAWYLPKSVTALVRPSDIGFLIGAIPIVLFFVNLARKATPEERPGLLSLLPIYVAGGTFFMVLHLNGSAMTMWARDLTDREVAWAEAGPDGSVPKVAEWFAQEALPGYYPNARPDLPRPNRLSLVAVESAAAVKMFGLQRMDPETLEALRQTLPADVQIREFPVGEVPDDDAWQDRAIDLYEDVTVEESVGAHGEKVVSVETPDDAERIGRAVVVRTIGDSEIPQYVVSPSTYESLYEGVEATDGQSAEELPPGQFLRTANPELYQSLNPFFVITLTPLVVAFFAWRMRKGKPISTARKIFYGMAITTLAVLFMALAGFATNNGESKVSWWWLVGFYAIVTVGELCLSPMALSLVTKLSPARFVGLTMGGWFFATAIGNKFSGFLGGLQARMEPSNFFLLIAAGVGVVALFIFLLLPKLDAAIKKYGA